MTSACPPTSQETGELLKPNSAVGACALTGTEGATEQRANRSTVLNMISTGASMAGTLPKTCQSCGMWPVGSPTGTRYGGEGEVLTL